MTLTVWTVGHSTRTADEFRAVLASQSIELVADVRRFPGSRRLPQFAQAALEADLHAHGLLYHWFPALGGRRSGGSDALDSGWRHRAFRAYAAHMLTEEFADGLAELLTMAYAVRTVIMCAELLWWRCHRRLIADVLVSLGVDVIDIRDAGFAEPHRLVPPAQLVDGALAYPPAP